MACLEELLLQAVEDLVLVHSYASSIHHLHCVILALSSHYCMLSWVDPFIMNAGITFSDPPLTSMSQLASSILSTSTVPSPLSPSQMLLLLVSSSSTCPSALTRSGNESCQMNILCILLFENGRRILHGSILSGIRSSSG